jgi:hypothetical protein
MPQTAVNGTISVPRPILLLASAAIAFHLFALIVRALAAPSGPWPSQESSSMVPPPQFAQGISETLTPTYLNYLRLTNDYHFPTNHPAVPDAYFVAKLRFNDSPETKTIRVPDEHANFWVRHRQNLLARALTNDAPVQPPQGESVAAPSQQVRTVQIWEQGDGGVLQVRTTPEHLIPRDRPVFRPGDWPKLLVRSYARYLCRTQGATSADIVRHWRDPISPAVLTMPDPPPQMFEEFAANFGELSR